MLDILFKWEFSARDKSLFKRKPTTDFKIIRNDFDEAVAESKIEKRAPRGSGYSDILASMISLCSTALKSCENTHAPLCCQSPGDHSHKSHCHEQGQPSLFTDSMSCISSTRHCARVQSCASDNCSDPARRHGRLEYQQPPL